MALGAQQLGTNEKVVALVGDASIVNGVSFEALNNLGLVKRQLLIVLNDNSMAIDPTEGAIAKFLSRIRLSHKYEDLRRRTNLILEHMPLLGKKMEGAVERFKKSLRMTFSGSPLFESLNIPYFGPVDGHDIGSLIELFSAMKNLDHPAILHVYTKKGKGFTPADDDPSKFHSTGPFEINGDSANVKTGGRSFTEAFGDALCQIAEKDSRIVAITAAMTDGTGLAKFREKFPNRYYDVGIAEEVAVDIAAGMAKTGLKPIVCIYSTFLQRSFDEIFQEVSLQNLPVIFCIDRAGLVGADGPTHHGLMDIGFMRMMPNMVLISPANEAELTPALEFAAKIDQPVAIRYPKDAVIDYPDTDACKADFQLGKSVTIRDRDSSVVLVCYGSILTEAIKAADLLVKENINVDIINARFAKPIDEKIISLLAAGKGIITIEDHGLACGFGSAVLEAANKIRRTADKHTKKRSYAEQIVILGGPDEFVLPHLRKRQLDEIGISAEKIVTAVKDMLNKVN
jgi:1-deoxy-D-xylulose-5-phosphate synthase